VREVRSVKRERHEVRVGREMKENEHRR